MGILEGLRIEPGIARSLSDLPIQEEHPGRKRRFIRGPIPADWIERAARLPGKALHVALMIRYLDGFEQTGTVKLRPSVRDAYGIDRFSCARALGHLETAGLITVRRKRGASPLVTISNGRSRDQLQ